MNALVCGTNEQWGSQIRGPSFLLTKYGTSIFVLVSIFNCEVKYMQMKVIFGSEENIILQNRFYLCLGLPSALFLCVFSAEVWYLRIVTLMLG
jgi:hypothetical protein